jgi:hypothetical protein
VAAPWVWQRIPADGQETITMSYPQGPDAPAPRRWPAPPPLQAPPPPEAPLASPKTSGPARRSLRILGVVAIAVVSWGIGLGMGLAGAEDDNGDPGPVATSRANDREDTDEPDGSPATTTTTAAPYVPQPTDFAINVVTLEKSCFGSAGCNITYTVELSYVGQPLDPSDTWQVIYDIAGGEQTQTETIEVTGSNYSYSPESFIQTPSEGAVLTATVTMVREGP